MNTNVEHNDMDRMKVLEMIEAGKISADVGATLLDTLNSRKSKQPGTSRTTVDPRWFRVRVTDTFSGRNKATVNIPFGLMDWGLKVGAQFSPEVSEIDLDELREALLTSTGGKIVEVIDDEGGEHVEVYVE